MEREARRSETAWEIALAGDPARGRLAALAGPERELAGPVEPGVELRVERRHFGLGDVQAEVVFSTLNPSSAYSFTAMTCTTGYCHGSGVTIKTSPAWTSTTPLACVDGCHGGDPNRTGMSSNHRRSEHKKPCATCHKSVVDANNNIINTGLHVNGAKNVQFTTASATYNPAHKSCTRTGSGCHGSGTQAGW